MEEKNDREDILRKSPVVLLGDLRLVEGAVEHGWIIVHVLDVNDNRRVVLIAVI
jgi:hypothetical protein